MTGSNAHDDEDVADVFGVENLRGARQVNEQTGERGLEQKERRAIVTENLRTPGFTNEVIMIKDAAMRFKFCASLQRDDEMFVTQANQLGKVAVARDGYVKVEGHASILP